MELLRLIKVLFKKDIYGYFNNDTEKVLIFLRQNCMDYAVLFDFSEIHNFFVNLILTRLISQMKPDIQIFNFMFNYMRCKVHKKVFKYYVMPFMKEEEFWQFYVTGLNKLYLTDQEKADYILVCLEDRFTSYYAKIIINNIKDKTIKQNIEMIIELSE